MWLMNKYVDDDKLVHEWIFDGLMTKDMEILT